MADSCLPAWAALCVHLPPAMPVFPWEHGDPEAQVDAVSAFAVQMPSKYVRKE